MYIRNYLLLLSVLQVVKGCSSTVETRYCSFSVNGISDNCTSLHFNFCLKNECDACTQLTTVKYLTWNQCMNNCCENSSDAPMTDQTLKNCQTECGKYLRVVFILTIIFSGLVTLQIIFLVLHQSVRQTDGDQSAMIDSIIFKELVYILYIIQISQTMDKTILFTSLIMISLSICQNQIEAAKCKFYIQPVYLECQTFLFEKCTYYYDTDKIILLTWGSCLYQCCDQSYGELSYQTLSNCDQYWTLAGKYVIATWTIGSVGLVLFIVGLFCIFITNWTACCFNLKQSWRRIFCCRREILNARNDSIPHSETSLKRPQIKWRRYLSFKQKGWQKQICVIFFQRTQMSS